MRLGPDGLKDFLLLLLPNLMVLLALDEEGLHGWAGGGGGLIRALPEG